jgi:opacity protein-like surface antigen
MASSSGFGRKARLGAGVLIALLGGKAMAAMPGLYFSGFYMDSTLAYSTADANETHFAAATGDVWDSYNFQVLSIDQSTLDKNDIGYGFAVGYQFSRYFAAEFALVDMSAARYSAQGQVLDTFDDSEYLGRTYLTTKARGPALSAIGIWPIGDMFALDARAGLLIGKAKLRYQVELSSGEFDVGSISTGSTSLILGAGVNFALSPGTAIRLGYTMLPGAVYGDRDIRAWNFSLKYAW